MIYVIANGNLPDAIRRTLDQFKGTSRHITTMEEVFKLSPEQDDYVIVANDVHTIKVVRNKSPKTTVIACMAKEEDSAKARTAGANLVFGYRGDIVGHLKSRMS